ncbi:plant intracellular Ras-group-related LRR protein 6, partial [Tanacetum coccineum]
MPFCLFLILILELAQRSYLLTELVLVGHGLSVVPPQVWETRDITKVDLSKNSIKTLSYLHVLPLRNKNKEWPNAVLESLHKLMCLNLDNNPVKQIPSTGFQAASKLQILDLSNNVGCLPEHPA